MGISGTLRTMSLADLMQWIFHSQKSGTLIIQGVTIEKRIFFENGFIVSTTSDDPREYLGQFLLSYGYITEEELTRAMEVQQQSNIMLGKILVMIGAITSDELQKLMRIKAEESLYEIFIWDEGEFTFIEDLLPEIKMVPLRLDPTKIIMEGLRRSDEWKRVRDVIPSMKSIPIRNESPPDDELKPREQMILDQCNGRHTVEDIAILTRARDFLSALTLFHLYNRGHVLFETPPEALAAQSHKERPLEDIDEAEIEVHRLMTRSGMQLKKGLLEQAWATIRKVQTLRPDDLGVEEKLEKTQSHILTQLEKSGIHASAVPRLAQPLDEISNASLSPREGFILTRINGQWDIKNLISLAPMHVVDAYLVIDSLRRRNLIEIDDGN